MKVGTQSHSATTEPTHESRPITTTNDVTLQIELQHESDDALPDYDDNIPPLTATTPVQHRQSSAEETDSELIRQKQDGDPYSPMESSVDELLNRPNPIDTTTLPNVPDGLEGQISYPYEEPPQPRQHFVNKLSAATEIDLPPPTAALTNEDNRKSTVKSIKKSMLRSQTQFINPHLADSTAIPKSKHSWKNAKAPKSNQYEEESSNETQQMLGTSTGDNFLYSTQESSTELNRMGSEDTLSLRAHTQRVFRDQLQLEDIRRKKRKRWYRPAYCIDKCMHQILGKLLVLIATWTTVINYGKDIYVAIHLLTEGEGIWFIVTLAVLFLSLRLMLFLLATDDDGASVCKLFLHYLPGSVYFDGSKMDSKVDCGVCILWELAILLGTPLMPFYLVILAFKKSKSLFSDTNFENTQLLVFAVVECFFETLPQLLIQSYLYFSKVHYGHHEVPDQVFYLAWAVAGVVLFKIPLIVWWNYGIVYKLAFKRRHNAEVRSVRMHPYLDMIATGSWDNTVLINDVIDAPQPIVKAKRVLDTEYNVNAVQWSPDGDTVAVAGQGVQIWNWRKREVLHHYPKSYSRDQLNRKKRHRMHEVKDVIFSPDGKELIYFKGKHIHVFDLSTKKERTKMKAELGDRRDEVNDIQCIALSNNRKYVAAGIFHGKINIFSFISGDFLRALSGHEQGVTAITFDRKCEYLISGSSDNTVRIWAIKGRNSWQQIRQFNGHSQEITCLSVDVTNRYIASGGVDKSLHIFYLANEALETVMRDDIQHSSNDKRFLGIITPATRNHSTSVTNVIALESKKKKSNANRAPIIYECVLLTTFDADRCESTVLSADFSPYGEFIAVGTEGHAVKLFRLPQDCTRGSIASFVPPQMINDI